MPDWLELLRLAVANQASDVFLSAGCSPKMRVRGELQQLGASAVLTDAYLANVLDCMLSAQQRQHLQAALEVDLAFQHEQIGRFRVHIFQHRRGVGLVLRVIALKPPRLDQLAGRDPLALTMLNAVADHTSGLVLFVGSTGSGKSSTQAAVVDALNRDGRRHIVCIEDPIEYVHPNTTGLIHQRQVGGHVSCFAQALRAALREAPDVIALGELRDATTIQLALEAAETGHLVLATCHASSAVHSVTRLLEGVPPGQRVLARSVLAASLVMVVYQQLTPAGTGSRVAAFELLNVTSAVRNLIREDKPAQLHSVMQTGRQQGMQTITQALQRLHSAGVIAAQ